MKESGIVLGVFHKQDSEREMERELFEISDLAYSVSIDVKETVTQKIERISPSLYIGEGKASEVKVMLKSLRCNVVIMTKPVSPVQLRNLEKSFGCKVIDRNELILSIFARNARSNISKIEVELAQYKYLLPRLTGQGIMMSRTGGGIGTRGPGETKLETDRRMIEQRIDFLEKKLAQYRNNSQQRMKNRNSLFTVSLLGYTNAGKTTLMNALTREKLYADDRLFTTLETTTRRLFKDILITDTIGFLANLPHELISSFSLTLKEVYESDLKLIVLDISDEYVKEKFDDVNRILDDLYPPRNDRVYVFNKTDSMVDESKVGYFKGHTLESIFISAKTGDNVREVRDTIMKKFLSSLKLVRVKADRQNGDMLKFIYGNGYIEKQKETKKSIIFDVYFSERNLNLLNKKYCPEDAG